jgi:hypothetical protein
VYARERRSSGSGSDLTTNLTERSLADSFVSRHQAKLVGLPRAILKRGVAMRTAEKKLIERNLDLLFEFEKYVLEHPKITEKIPRDAVLFMKVAGDEKFNLWSERQAKKQAKKGAPLISVTVKKMGPVHSRIEGLALERAA